MIPNPQQAYPHKWLGGYPDAMSFDASETLFSGQALLWAAASVVAALLLFGSMNRRRSRLTESLRDFVDKNQQQSEISQPEGDESTPPKE